MLLSDRDIKKAVAKGRIKITPKPDFKKQLGSCSIDFHLGNRFRIFKHSTHPFVDLMGEVDVANIMEEVVVPKGKAFILQPGDFAIATTIERLKLAPDIAGRIEGRSSLGRLGIIVHSTAGLFDPGWDGKPTMELGNLGVMPVTLYPGMRICAFTFEELSSKVDVPYSKKKGAKYAGAKNADASKLGKEVKKEIEK
ncbi:MAG: dCTP deaminase [Candidatus Colwellbacteria bacterium]|nr:dCTP deaminase [Candidatus Colwellbacteria bacterium]